MPNGEREMRCTVRRAEQAEVQAVLAFAAQIFADEQQIPREMNVIPAEKQPQWFCMKQDGVLAGTAAVYREGGRWHMGRITVAPSLRGQHRGTFLMKSVLTEVFAQGVDEIFLEARDATVLSCVASVRSRRGAVCVLSRPRHAHPAEAHGFRAQYPEITEGVPWQSIFITASRADRAETAVCMSRTARRC